MEQVADLQSSEQGEETKKVCPLVFLDTNVIVGYLRGDPPALQLFSAEANGQIRFAINPIVLQELLLAEDKTALPQFERIHDHLLVLPVDFARAEALLPLARVSRGRPAHSNDILIMSSAAECDFLVTEDMLLLKNLVPNGKPQVVTPGEMVRNLRVA